MAVTPSTAFWPSVTSVPMVGSETPTPVPVTPMVAAPPPSRAAVNPVTTVTPIRSRHPHRPLGPGQFPLATEFEAPDIKYAPLMGNRPEFGPSGPPTFGPRIPRVTQTPPHPTPSVVIEHSPTTFGTASPKAVVVSNSGQRGTTRGGRRRRRRRRKNGLSILRGRYQQTKHDIRTKGFKGTALDWLPVHPNNALYGPTREAIRNYADAFNYYYVYPIRKFLNKTELELRCPNCENYADAFHYYYVHPFRKLLNATELPTLSQLVGEEDDTKGKRPIRLSTERRRIHFHEVYVGKIESTPRMSNRSQVSKWMPQWKFQSIL